MPLITDTRRGDWLRARVGRWATPGGVAGTGFTAYVRVLHPLYAYRHSFATVDGADGETVLEERTWRWGDVADRVGRRMHPLVQWVHLTGHQPPHAVESDDGWTIGPPEEGQLDTDVLAALTGHLRRATTTPTDVVAAVWNGWGELHGGGSSSASFFIGEPTAEDLRLQQRRDAEQRQHRDAVARALSGPLFELPGRAFHLMSVTLDLFGDPGWLESTSAAVYPAAGRTPQLLWPEDHAWVLATEIDWDATIIAGDAELIASVVADDRFEAFEVQVDDDLSWAGDTINTN